MKFMKGLGKCICCVLALVLLCNPIYVFAEDTEDFSITNGSHTLDGTSPLLGSGSFENTQSAILYETNSDTLLYAWNPDLELSPSSFAKLVTAIIAIEQADLSETVIADEGALSTIPWDAASVGIQPGEEMTLLDLLYCMLVGSGNDASAVIAAHIDGSIEKFVQRMNDFALSIGCTSSNFTNPHGLHNAHQYTTARDTAKILAYAIKNETFAKLIGTKEYTVPATNLKGERTLTTNNYLISRTVMSLYYDSRVTGGRTGVANDNSRCVAATAQKGTMNLISVVMGCRNSYNSDGSVDSFGGFPETTELLDKGFQSLRTVQVFYPGQVLKQYPLANADADLYIGVNDSFKTVLPSSVGTDDLRYIFQETGVLSAPVEAGAPYGIVNVYHGSVCVVSTPIYALNNVSVFEENLIVDREEDDPNGLSVGVVLAIVAAVFIILLILLRYSKMFRKIVGRKRRRKRRM